MAYRKRLWSSLAPSTKAKYKRAGVTPAMYNNPKRHVENRDLFLTAQGKAPVSYLAQRAKDVGLLPDVNLRLTPKRELNKLVDAVQDQIAPTGYRHDVFAKASWYGMNDSDQVIPFSKLSDDEKFRAAQLWNDVMDTRDHELKSNKYRESDFVAAKNQFLGWLDEQGIKTDVEDWQFFRELYKSAFG